ncbi:MAG: FG-GAP-like repeat-containing protein, partial [Planctomycetota bacterium]
MTDVPKSQGRAWLPLLLLLAVAGGIGLYFALREPSVEPGPSTSEPQEIDAEETERGLVHFPMSPEERVARERAAAFFRKDRMGRAREALTPFAEGDDVSLTVLLDMAAIEFSAGQFEETDRWLARAEALDPEAPRLIYLQAQRARGMGEFEKALPLFQKVHEALPSDFPTMIGLGQVLAGLERPEEAEALYRQVISYGPEHAGSWYMSAVYRMTRLLLEDGREEEAERFFVILDEGKERGFKPPTAAQVSHGELGVVLIPSPTATERGPREAGQFEELEELSDELREAFRGATSLATVDYDGDRDRDLLGSGPEGVTLARNDRADDEWTLVDLPPLPPSTQPYYAAAPIDLDNDGAHDLAVLHGGTLFLFQQTEEGFVLLEKNRLPELIGTLPERTIVDFAVRDWDHEGDLDLVLVLDSGAARLWRNDGFSGSDQGKFTDATVESGLPEFVRDARWVALEDFDGDNDVDLLFGSSGLILADGLRGGKFG